jgi:hypothetical protein
MTLVPVVVHPQAILQMADHFSRMPYFGRADPRASQRNPEYVCGFIIGVVEDEVIKVRAVFDALVRGANPNLSIDRGAFRTIYRVHKAIYPNEVIVGWYSCRRLTPEEISLLHSVFEAVDHSGPFIRGEFLDRDPPLALFAPRGGDWTKIEYSYESELAERIAMMHLQAEGNAESQVAFTADAFRTLDHDLEVIQQYLELVAAGKTPFDETRVRRCADVAQWWTHKKQEAREDEMIEQENLALLVGGMAERVAELQGRLRGARPQ